MTFNRLCVLSLLFLLAACEAATPIAIYVTPTPEATVESQARLTSASEAQSVAALTTPIATVGPIVQTFTPAPPPATQPAPTPEGIQLNEGDLRPTVTFIGPIIGPEYTLPPTDTPRPTTTPSPTLTPTEGPSPTPTVTATPLPGQPTPLPDLNPALMGIQLDPNLSVEDWNEAIRRLQENVSVGWIKVQLSWKALQPNGPDEFGEPFQRLELFLQDADRRGFKILVSVAKAPNWARSNTTEDGPPDDPQRLAEFMMFMLTRLGSSIDAVEVWNEPNLIREWQGVLPKGGGGYMTLFAPSYQAIRNYSQSIIVVTAGLAPTGDNAGLSVDDRAYLRQMYAAGLANYKDVAIGAHPYSWANPPDATCCGTLGWDDDPHFFFADNMRDYRRIMDQNGHVNNQLWVTEFGWATWDGLPGEAPEAWMARTDQWEQANYTIRAFQIGQQTPNVGPMILWNLNFALLAGKIESRDERAAYSLVLPAPMPERPLYWMIYDAIRPDQQLVHSQ